MIVDIILAVAIAVLAGLGLGSGGFLIIYLVFVRGMAERTAQGINLWFFIFALAASCVVHIKKRRAKLSVILLMSIPGAMGAVFGGCLLPVINTEWLTRAFGVFLVLSGIYTLFYKRT